jgi:HEAT repeat protein
MRWKTFELLLGAASSLVIVLSIAAGWMDGVAALVSEEKRGDEEEGARTWKEERVRLRSNDKWVRKSAVEALARFDTREAWELVVSALGDDRGEVADTAQFLLAEVTDFVDFGAFDTE